MDQFGADRAIWEAKYRERSTNRATNYRVIANTQMVFQLGGGEVDMMWKLKECVAAGGDINWHNPKWRNGTALMFAAGNGCLEQVKYFVEKGAELDALDRDGATALGFCCTKAEIPSIVAAMKEMTEAGADPNIADAQGQTPLYVATVNNCQEFMKLLLNMGADQSLADSSGNWPLLMACQAANIDAIKLLMQYGAPLFQAHKDGYTALEFAARCGHREVVALIRKQIEVMETRASAEEEMEAAMEDAVHGHHFG